MGSYPGNYRNRIWKLLPPIFALRPEPGSTSFSWGPPVAEYGRGAYSLWRLPSIHQHSRNAVGDGFALRIQAFYLRRLCQAIATAQMPSFGRP